mgnify:CR=1 FL=1
MKEILKRIYSDFQDKNFEITKREAVLPDISGRIHTIIGPRRAGKTFFLYQIIAGLIKSGTGRDKILFLNFEDERLKFTQDDNYDVIFDAFLELHPGTRPAELHIFFDEIQTLPKWEKFVRRVFDGVSRNLYITGSNSAMLSKEIASSLRGRNYATRVLPLSFREYLKFKKIDLKNRHGLSGSSKINAVFSEFLVFGGYPEIVSYPPEIKISVLQNYFDLIIYRDLIERYDIGRPDILRYLMKKIVASATKEFSVNKIYNELKSSGHSVSKDTLYSIVEYIKNIFFCEFVEKHHRSVSVREGLNKKTYLYDSGIMSALNFGLSQDRGKLLENMVFIELIRRNSNVFYAKNGFECDFIITGRAGKDTAVQVVYELNGENYKREIAGLEAVRASKKMLIYKENNSGVKDSRFIDIIDWLLEGGII